MTPTAGRLRSAVVVLALCVLGGGALEAPPALAHGEGLTPYLYVTAPPGVASAGTPEQGVSTQPLGRFGFAGTSDNQMQLTLPEGVLPPRDGEQGVRVQLDQLDPATLPTLPPGLEAEGNGYRVSLSYAPSGTPLDRLAGPASLGLSAPAAPTGVYELVKGRWVAALFTPVAVESGFSSVVARAGPGTFLQAYEPAPAGAFAEKPDVDLRSSDGTDRSPAVPAGLAVLGWLGWLGGLGLLGLLLLRRSRSSGVGETGPR